MIRSMEGFTFASALDLNMGYYHIKFDADTQNAMYNCIPMAYEKIQMQTLTHWYFQNVISKLVQDMLHVKTYLDDLLILINSV
jgi:hypothetical protein